MKVKGIIFDFDGTLVQSNSLKVQGFYAVTRHIPGAKDCLDNLFLKQPYLDRFQLLTSVSKETDHNSPKELIEAYSEWINHALKQVKEVPGARAFLDKAKRHRVPMAICSATPEMHIEQAIHMTGLDGFFTHVKGGMYSKSKGARNILRDWKVSFDEINSIVFIGDTDNDRKAAIDLGCRFIAIENNFNDFNVRPGEIYATYEEVALNLL